MMYTVWVIHKGFKSTLRMGCAGRGPEGTTRCLFTKDLAERLVAFYKEAGDDAGMDEYDYSHKPHDEPVDDPR